MTPARACALRLAGARHEGLGILSKCSLQGLGEGKVAASSFRTSYVPLNKQADFINGMQVSPAMLFSYVELQTCLGWPCSCCRAIPSHPPVLAVSGCSVLSVGLNSVHLPLEEQLRKE